MLQDLDAIHRTLLDAYKAIMKLIGVDLEAASEKQIKLPTATYRYEVMPFDSGVRPRSVARVLGDDAQDGGWRATG